MTVEAPLKNHKGVKKMIISLFDQTDEFFERAEKCRREACEITHEIREKAVKKRNLYRKIKFLKKIVPYSTIVNTLGGFAIGVYLMVHLVLQNHGPTVTIAGTISACACYLVSGLLFAYILGSLGREIPMDLVENKRADYLSLACEISELEKSSKEKANQAKKYYQAGREKRVQAWRDGGFF